VDREQHERYSRQIRLPRIGVAGQQRLLDSRALIIGMGGLGSPAAMYLAAAGIGRLVISDYDRVEPSNLQRQIVHRHDDIGQPKALSARATLLSINPDIEVTAVDWELDDAELAEQVKLADVVLDCSDNFPTRFAINRCCVATGTPLVSGAAIRMEGQVATFLPAQAHSPCYQCLYSGELEQAATCAEEGVVAPLVGIIGSMQAMQAMLVLTGLEEALPGRLLLLDAHGMEWRAVGLTRDPACPACSQRP
jgi:molybdopterin/thiamine biosynthesis adenylyltransferase